MPCQVAYVTVGVVGGTSGLGHGRTDLAFRLKVFWGLGLLGGMEGRGIMGHGRLVRRMFEVQGISRLEFRAFAG